MRRNLALAIAGASIVATATLVASCSLITTFDECSVDADCTAKFSARATCEDSICVASSGVTGGTCLQTMGNVDHPDSLLVGVLLPLTGPEGGFGVPLLNAVELAFGNFDKIGGIGEKPLGLLICDTEGVDDVALEAARFAIEEAKVTAIVGPDFSSQTIAIATQYAIPNDVLMVTPAATAATISGLEDKNLIWRTAPSDTVQGDALSQLVAHFITNELSADLASATVWVLTREGDTYGEGMRERLYGTFPDALSNSSNLHPSVYPEDWVDSWFGDTAAQLPAPDVVVVLGAAEAWDIAEAIDSTFDSAPTFFFADAARNAEEAGRTDIALQGRVRGTAPKAVGDLSYTPYTNFRVKYQAQFDADPNDLQFVANAYDALHVVALAAAGGGGTSGPLLAVGMGMLSSGTEIDATSEDVQEGIRLLSSGETIDFRGASGRLDFDANGDPSPTTIIMWCFDNAGLPEAGDLLSTAGTFTPLDCSVTANNVNNVMPDMGTGSTDMGSTDMNVAD